MTTDKAKPSAFRLLVLTPIVRSISTNPLVKCLEAITGTQPAETLRSYAGYTSHPPLRLRTKYYKSDVSIWCDELPLPESNSVAPNGTSESTRISSDISTDESLSLEEWKEQMLSPAAEEVRSAIGGILLVLPMEHQIGSNSLEPYFSLVEAVNNLREAIEDESNGRDIAAVVMLQNTRANDSRPNDINLLVERLEDECVTGRGIFGWDFVAWDGDVDADVGAASRNELGEKQGIARVIEVLEGIDWSAPLHDKEESDVEDVLSNESNDILGRSRYTGLDSELQKEMMGLKLSMLEQQEQNEELNDTEDEGEDLSIEQMQALMARVVRIREAGADMPKDERERFAKTEVGKIMKELG